MWKRREPAYFLDFQTTQFSRIRVLEQKLESYVAFRDAEPNAVHEACFALEQEGKVVSVVTQNVDGLHTRAGMSVACLVECIDARPGIGCPATATAIEILTILRRQPRTSVPINLRRKCVLREKRSSRSRPLLIHSGHSSSSPMGKRNEHVLPS